jgi:MFS transporter, MHS family, proline/betaine transporter
VPVTERTRVVLAGAVGNIVEWYDFGLYGLLAPVLASLFFPSHDRIAGLLAVYGGFAIGFAVRPIGAIVLGGLGDRVGRRFVLLVSVVLMGVSTVAVGLLPTHQTIGSWAAVLLIMTRLFQGFSVGGEFVGSVTYLVESAPQGRRGLAGSVANLGATAGILLAGGVSSLLMTWATPGQLHSWAWRVPFLLGGVFASAAYLLRKHIPGNEHEPLPDSKQRRASPLWQAFRQQPKIMVASLVFTCGYGIVNYLTMVFLPTYAHEFGNVSEKQALSINTAGQALALFVVPLAGWMSDHVFTRRRFLVLVFATEAIVSWEAFRLVRDNGVAGTWIAQLSFAGLLALVMGAAPSMLAEQFRAGFRVTAHAFVLNVGIGIAGGTSPMVATELIRLTSNPMAPAMYLIFSAAVAAVALLALSDRSRLDLD